MEVLKRVRDYHPPHWGWRGLLLHQKEKKQGEVPVPKSAASAAGPAVEEDPDVLKLSKELSDFSVGESAKTSKSKTKPSLGSKLNLSSLKSALTKSESKKVEFEQPEGEEEDEE